MCITAYVFSPYFAQTKHTMEAATGPIVLYTVKKIVNMTKKCGKVDF
jgi:hypothetical protein